MSQELKHTYLLKAWLTPTSEVFQEREVKPKGSFKIRHEKTDSYFREVLEGAMVFTEDDFLWIYTKPLCTLFVIECNFKGVTWNGVFTRMDCNPIHVDKKYIEVIPAPYDSYRDFLPYLGLTYNILERNETVTSVKQTRAYQKERIVVDITDPYVGPNSGVWEGYSVNDWIGGAQTDYSKNNGKRNSLIYYLSFTSIIGSADIDFWNQWYWLDYVGYEAKISGHTIEEFRLRILQGELYTLSEVINHYNELKQWQKCTLVYEREVWEHPAGAKPPSGKLYTEENQRGWYQSENDPKYRRRALNMSDEMVPLSVPLESRPSISGDGTWYTPLMDYERPQGQKEGWIRKQVLYVNRKFESLHGEAWFNVMYGEITVVGRYRTVASVFESFLKYVQEKGGNYYPFTSLYFSEEISPITGFGNDWYNLLLAQNSDFKRPDSTEKATRQEFTFGDFLRAFCALTNTGWAIINGEFRLEHIKFFDNGLSYAEGEGEIINPASIQNAALNKGFLNLSSQFYFDHPDMQKYEIFNTDGGTEKNFNKTEIEYSSPCAYNYPDNNIREINTAGLTIDPQWVQSEGPDGGLVFLRAINLGEQVSTQRVYRLKFENYQDFQSDRGKIIFGFNIPRIGSQAQWTFDMALPVYGNDNFLDSLQIFVNNNPTRTLNNGFQIGLRMAEPSTGGHIEFYGIEGTGFEIFYANVPNVTQLPGSTIITIRYQTPFLAWFIQPIMALIYGSQASAYQSFAISYSKDKYGRWGVNYDFDLEYVLRTYHRYGRSFNSGTINGKHYSFIPKHVVTHDISFPYRLNLNPYNKVLTELGIGIIKDNTFDAKTGMTEMKVGYVLPNAEYVEDYPAYDDIFIPPYPQPVLPIQFGFYVHHQETAEQTWFIGHHVGIFMRPLVLKRTETGFSEIEYDSLRVLTGGLAEVGFTVPVEGKAYFLTLETINGEFTKTHVQETPELVWEIPHTLGTAALCFSPITNESGEEIGHNELEVTDLMVKVSFTVPMSGEITFAALNPDVDPINSDYFQKGGDFLKPLVLKMDKETEYDYLLLEDYLLKLGFTKEMIGYVIVKYVP